MNYERVHLVYYIFTTITVLFTLLGLGKFFCVPRLYKLYDDINEAIDNGLTPIITISALFNVFAVIGLVLNVKGMILLSCVLMMIGLFILTICLVVSGIILLSKKLYSLHEELKHKRNLR